MSLLEARGRLAWNGPLISLLGLTTAVLIGLALVRLPPVEAAALVGVGAVVIGALIEPFVGLGVALLVGPLKAYLSAEVPQVPAQVGHAFVALAVGSWLLRRLSDRDVRVDQIRTPVFLALIVFLGAALLSLWDAVGLVAYGIPELIKWAEMLVLFVFVKEHLAVGGGSPVTAGATDAEQVGWRRRLGLLLVALLGTGVFQALVGLWQFGLRGEGPEHFRIAGGGFFRAYGTFEQPNPYAGYLGFTAALAAGIVLGLVWDRLVRCRAAGPQGEAGEAVSLRVPGQADQGALGAASLSIYGLGGAAAITMVVALVASWSRGAWIGFGAAVLAMAFALPRRTVWSIFLVGSLVLLGVGVWASGSVPPAFAARLTSFVRDIRLEDVRGIPINDANYAVVERLAHWQAGLSMFRRDLWTGVGLGCYEAAYPAFRLINWPIALGHAHNIYLNLAAETGLIGLTAYVVLWVVVLWQTWWATRRGRGLMRGLAIGLLGAWAHISVHHLLDNLYVNNVHLHIGVLLGLAAFLGERASRLTTRYDGQG